MRIKSVSLVGFIAAIVSVTAVAEEIYKGVDENGVVEYSDTPIPDAKKIEVNPNVVEVTPVEPTAPRREAAGGQQSQPQSESDAELRTEDVNDVDRLEREKRRARDVGVERHENKGPEAGAARGAGARQTERVEHGGVRHRGR